ncbi:hypothetical protein WDZ17_01115 [Pseudokineococcus basanitobsidens]|uniref:Uncharacterized protein n=1 Tax=Pseudokineococcus basanitobsidens TaxID=1926649 RepID=A0ABU8RFY4_9ACTN
MRRKLATITVAGALALGGAALAGPALADTTAQEAADAVTSRVARITDALGGLVSDGTLTQDQADDVAATLADELPGRGGPGDGPGDGDGSGDGDGPGGGHHGGGLVMGLDAAADALSMTPEELRDALAEDGATLASVAEDQGVSTDDLVAALVDAAQAHLDEEVAEGDLTQADADARAADLEDRISELVTRELPDRGDHGPGHGPRGDRGGSGTTDDGSTDGSTGGSTDGTTPEGGTTATPSGWTYAA